MTDYNIKGALPSRGFSEVPPTDVGSERWTGDGISLTKDAKLDYWLLAGDGLGHDWLMFKTVAQLDLLLKLIRDSRALAELKRSRQ